LLARDVAAIGRRGSVLLPLGFAGAPAELIGTSDELAGGVASRDELSISILGSR